MTNHSSPSRITLILITLFLLSGFLCACQPIQPAIPPPAPTPTALHSSQTPPPVPMQTQPPAVIFTPTLAPIEATADCAEQPGQVQALQIASNLIHKPLRFNLYLPPCYSPTPPRRYPLLILLHGQIYNEEQWLRLGVPQTADRLIVEQGARPFLIVFPFEEYALKDVSESAYGQALAEELLPWLDAAHPTCTERACRAVGGISRGGAWALHIGLTFWQFFGAAGGHSPVPFALDANNLRQITASIPPDQLPAFYLDMGGQDAYLLAANGFHQRMQELDIPHTWLVPAGAHDESYWQAHAAEYLAWYMTHWTKETP